MACSLGFYGDGISFRVVFSQSFWIRVLPGGACLVQPRWMPERRILGGGLTCGVSFWPFRNSSGWWRLFSSMFLTRTSCRKTTHANSYYGAWPGWAVSINVLPLTILFTSKFVLLLLHQLPFNYINISIPISSLPNFLCPQILGFYFLIRMWLNLVL